MRHFSEVVIAAAATASNLSDAESSDAQSPATDKQLWEKASAGDVDAFGLIFLRHANRVHDYCVRRLGVQDVQGAEDITSIVFLEAWRRRTAVVLVAESALPWLLGIARHVVAHHWRSKLRHQRALERLHLSLSQIPDLAEDAVSRVDSSREIIAIRQAFATLSDTDQDVLAICVGQELDYESAAVILGIRVGTVGSRLSRARSRLKIATEAALKHSKESMKSGT